MKYDIEVMVTVATTDGKHSLAVSISDFIIEECCRDGTLFEQWDDDFKQLGDDWASCWSDVADELPEMQALLEHYWKQSEAGENISIIYTVDPTNVLPLLKKYNRKYFDWMIGFKNQIRAVEELNSRGEEYGEREVLDLMNSYAKSDRL